MKLKYKFEFVDLDDEIIMVPLGLNAEKVHGVLKVNKTGQEIISLLAEETNEDKIVDILAAKYENDRNTLKQYVQSLVKTLQENNLLEEC